MRGTTPTHTFNLPLDTALLKSVRIIYAYNGSPVLVKNTDQCTLEGNTVSVKLTQEDTLSFKNNVLIDIQLRALTKEGDALRSGVYSRHSGILLDDEVLL